MTALAKQEQPCKVACERCNGDGRTYDDCDRCDGARPDGCPGCDEHGFRYYDCGACGATGQSRTVYANVYAVTRHYGGSEEGGWWYNAGEPLESRRIDPSEATESYRKQLQDDWSGDAWGDIYSMAGGQGISVCFEPGFAESWPESRPRYE